MGTNGVTPNSEVASKLCPFLGMILVPGARGSIMRGPQELELQIQMQGCVEERCMFWRASEKVCGIKTAAEALTSAGQLLEQNKSKLGLFNLFGKKP